ncbi:MAG: site-specific tyrosine recombinase XerD [Kiritimatiellae bacterium]|nr:site-specific tyrosine recombinase XerD [Kiritimatiellia bacterium]
MIDSDIDEFIGSLRYERSMAENTCAAYARDLRFFSQYLKKRGISAAGDVKREDIAGFLGEQRSEGRKSTTRARRATAIKVFFKFLRERRFVAKNPAELLEPPKKAKALPRVLSEEETFRMLDKVDGTDPRDLRDRAMLEVMYGCGLRVSELCAMKTEDIIADGELLRVIGKGSKERIVPIGRAAGRALVAYLASARDVFTKGDLSVGHVFVTRLKKPFTRQAVFKLIRERALAAGIAPERISPHVLRHCFASHMLQHGADIRAIQELLGHADIGTTQIYTHVDATRFGDIHRRFHPRG